jgi:hypothetical protein
MPKQKQVVRIADANLSADPVVSLGLRMVELNRLGEQEEERSNRLTAAGDDDGASHASWLRGQLSCREWNLGEAAVSLPAGSFGGAILQSMLAGCMVDMALASEKSPSTDEQLELAQRALYSIRGFLERVSGLKADELFGGFYVNDHVNPFATIERGAGAGIETIATSPAGRA